MADNRAQKKVLFTATVDRHILAFHVPYLKWFSEQGWETHVASCPEGSARTGEPDAAPADGRDRGAGILPYCAHKYDIDIRRSPFDRANMRAYDQIKTILRENRFDIIHCHTPMGGALTRLAARRCRRQGTKVLYTAHGFHFYAGGPRRSWLLYYPAERILSGMTDCIITINGADQEIASKRFRAGKTVLSKGVGYDERRFFPHDEGDRARLRDALGFDQKSLLLVYVAELNPDKNQTVLIDMMKLLKDRAADRDIRLLLVGGDATEGRFGDYSEQTGVSDRVHFLGQRTDVDRIIPMCDITVASSLREGLGINVLESMACGIPVIASTANGHKELIRNGRNGLLVNGKDAEAFASSVLQLAADRNLRFSLAAGGVVSARAYTTEKAARVLESVYREYM